MVNLSPLLKQYPSDDFARCWVYCNIIALWLIETHSIPGPAWSRGLFWLWWFFLSTLVVPSYTCTHQYSLKPQGRFSTDNQSSFSIATLCLRFSAPWILAVYSSWIFNSASLTQEYWLALLGFFLSWPQSRNCLGSNMGRLLGSPDLLPFS